MSAEDDWMKSGTAAERMLQSTAAERMLHGTRATDEMARGGSVAAKHLEDERRRRALIGEALGSATAMAGALKRGGRTTDDLRGASVADRFIEEERRMRAMIDGSGRIGMGAQAGAMKAQRGIQDAITGATGGSLADKASREALNGSLVSRTEREMLGGGITGKAMQEALQASLADLAATDARLAGYPGAAGKMVRTALGTGVPANPAVGTAAPARARKETPEPVTERHHSSHVHVYAPGEPIGSPAALGARIRAARRGMGMNQQRFADLAGVGRRFLSEVEAGKPSAEFGKVLACCAAAGIDLCSRTR